MTVKPHVKEDAPRAPVIIDLLKALEAIVQEPASHSPKDLWLGTVDGWHVATDGYCLVALCQEDLGLPPLSRDVVSTFARRFISAELMNPEDGPPARLVDMARLRAWVEPGACVACKGTRFVRCTECEGKRRVECECYKCADLHQAECSECDSRGMPCTACQRGGPRPGNILGARIDRWILERVLKTAPVGALTVHLTRYEAPTKLWPEPKDPADAYPLALFHPGWRAIVVPMTPAPKEGEEEFE